MNIDHSWPEKPTLIENHPQEILEADLSVDTIIGAAFHRGPQRRRGYRLTGWLLISVLTDLLIITACTGLFLMAGSLVLKWSPQYEFNQWVQSYFHQKVFKETAIILFGYISILYFIFFRIFLSATIGEWSCGLRIGQPSERMKSSYAFKVILRVLLISCTGVIVFPVLSLLFKKDLAGHLTRASLYTLK